MADSAPGQPGPVVTVAPGGDLLTALADRLVADHADTLPDLSGIRVLLPDPLAGARLRRLLLERAAAHGHGALLGPAIETLRHAALAAGGGERLISEQARELLLVAALREHPALFGDGNPWAVAESLLTLFDELALSGADPGPELDGFAERLARGYGTSARGAGALDLEARLVHTLWHAWHEQMDGDGFLDAANAYARGLTTLAADDPGPLYLAGFTSLQDVEGRAVARLLERGAAVLVCHEPRAAAPPGDEPPLEPLLELAERHASAAPPADSPLGGLLSAVYDDAGEPLAERAQAFARQTPKSPAADRLAFYRAGGTEEQAQAVELQVRRWLLDGHQRVGILTDDRRLARRVRALLERSGLTVRDAAGWALSTTAAAALLERWLQCVEEDFPFRPLLDVVKSPFLETGDERDTWLATVYRLEQDLIHHEGVARGLNRYRRHLEFRRHRLPGDMGDRLAPVARLLAHLEEAAAPLTPLADGAPRPPGELLAAVQASLAALGAESGLAADAAGARLLRTLEEMRRGGGDEAPAVTWGEFRAWLGRNLERTRFVPPVENDRLVLADLGHGTLERFDALVLAGAERAHLPGEAAASPFFNDAVRRQLGLPPAARRRAARFRQFRHALEAAPRVLVSLRAREGDEDIAASPWVDGLQAFHRLAYGDGLEAAGLASLVGAPNTRPASEPEAPRPAPHTRPAPAALPALVPQTVTAGAYQELMDCPYQFFAARCLHLAAPETIREALEKSDYGERVHRCLEAFHGHVRGLPGPLEEPVSAAGRARATALLTEIAEAVFAADTEDNFLHRGWLQRWLAALPAYLAWQQGRETAWRPDAVEVRAERPDFAPGLNLKGRLDRIDRGEEGYAVLDYKTGALPDRAAVEEGEAVQLPFYALLAEGSGHTPVARVEYLALDGDRVGSRSVLEGDETVEPLKSAVGERLKGLMDAVREGAGLPAWGDEATCGRCRMEGVCRRQAWTAGEPAPQ